MSSVSNINKLIRSFVAKGNFNAIFDPIEVVYADDHCLKCRFKVTEKESNSLSTLHGGYTSSLVDFISTIDLRRRGVNSSVSVDLATSFMRAAPVGSWISVESYVLKQGKTLAFCEVNLLDEATGRLVAKGRHTKFLS
ncbi:unnamed protein product [Mesocestoides corti]|nr:unnamed protein product [Mesocestoides corti]